MENPATCGNGQMIAFIAPDRSAVDRAHADALALGGVCEGAPGLRPQYHLHTTERIFAIPIATRFASVVTIWSSKRTPLGILPDQSP
jgi:hypothetical protein